MSAGGPVRMVVSLLIIAVCLALSSPAAAESIKELRARAEQGDADAQSNLGLKYYNGRDVPRDYAEALLWFRRAAEQGNASGQNSLGWMYMNGKGVPQDYAEALRWYRKAAEQGNASGQNNLGMMYRNGRGVPQDYAEAVRWYRKAAEQGNAFGQFDLGRMYENGWGVPQASALALYWYNKAAEQGGKEARDAALRLKAAGIVPRAPGTNDAEPSVAQPQPQPEPQIDRRLAIDEIEELLKGSVSPPRVTTLVQQYGVNFELSDEAEKRLRGLGADDKLLIAIAKNRR